MLFDETTLRKLNQLALVAHKVRSGAIKGDRHSTRRGTSIEFADYRNYAPGDDLRHLDWNVYARLERPFIKLLEEEEDLAVHILVDASKSMDWDVDAHNKFNYALRLSAALSAIALGAGDQLTLAILHEHETKAQYGPARGQQHLLRLLAFLEQQKAAGVTDLAGSLYAYLLTNRRPGLVFLISDLFSESGWQTSLGHFLSRGNEVILLHILSPDELEPPLAGDLRLVDIETGHAQEVTVDGAMRMRYQRRVNAWKDELRAECLKKDVRYIPLDTSHPWDELVLLDLRRAGIVK